MAQQPEKLSPAEQAKLDEAGRRYKEEAGRKKTTAAYNRAITYPETADVVNPPNAIKKAKGGVIKSSASRRADGIAQRGKTKGRFV